MRNSQADVVACATEVLDHYGLADLTMRRLASELGVRPSALYHHFPDKQTLLAAVADEILARGLSKPPAPAGPWDAVALAACRRVRDALLAYRDGAELIATARGYGLGGAAAYDEIAGALGFLDSDLRPTAARALLHLVLGHVGEEQTHLQALAVGAVDGSPRDGSDFDAAVGLVLDGLAAHRSASQGASDDAGGEPLTDARSGSASARRRPGSQPGW